MPTLPSDALLPQGELASAIAVPAVIGQALAADSPGQPAGANQAITTDPGVQQMPSVAVDPLDPDHVVIAYMDYALLSTGYAGIGVAVSHDGGQRWQNKDDKGQPYSVSLPQGFEQGAANPTAKFDSEGRVFISFMATTFLGEKPPITNPGGGPLRTLGFQANNGIFVSRSDDGGLSWQTPVAVASHRYDGDHKVPFEIMPDLAIDTFRTLPDGQANPNYGSLYEVWSRYYPEGQYPGEPDSSAGSNIMIAVSRDGGQHWQLQLEPHPAESSDPVTVIFNKTHFIGSGVPPGQGFENWSHVTVGPEGDVYVSQFLGGQFVVHHSFDGGKSFDHPDSMTEALFPFGLNNPVNPGPLSTQKFRLQVVRAIVADPMRPGHIYVAEGNSILDPQENSLDEGDVVFARSTDYGVTWQTTFQVDTRTARVINDDNDGRSSGGLADDVANGQALPRLVSDAQGNVALIWYDTRRDPAGHLLDVFAAVSSDGGLSFSRNFRVTDQSFDADAGRFTDVTGKTDFYLGDFLGLALANNEMFAGWTDARQDNQDIFFSRVALDPLPAPPNDRFEPNDAQDTATRIGPDPIFNRSLPRLTLVAGEDDWFQITPPTGLLSVTAESSDNAANLRLELFDAEAMSVPATTSTLVNSDGNVVKAQILKARVEPGQTYRVRVHSTAEVGSAAGDIGYSLNFTTLTANLGEVVHQVVEGAIADGDQTYYLVQSKVAGSVKATLTVAANFQGAPTIELSDLRDPSKVLASSGLDSPFATVPVEAGQQLLVHVTGGDTAAGTFRVELTNFDQFNTPDKKTLIFPAGQGPSEAVIADLNGDGALDIVVSHVGRDVISVLVNNGDGTYRAPRDFAVGAFQQGGPFTLQGLQNFHRDLAIADFNRDGRPDVVVVNTSSSDISVLLGNGDGTFQPQRRFDATAAPFALAVGDLDNDGIPDLAVVDSTAGPAKGGVLLGRGDGTFQPLRSFPLTPEEPYRTNSIRIADVNRDGKNDLLVRDFFDGTVLLLGNGDGTFRLNVKAVQGISGPGLAIADLDGDGMLDIVTTKNNSSQVVYTLGNGDGTFQPETTSTFSGQFPVAVDVADFATVMADGSIVVGVPDGRQDLIVLSLPRRSWLALCDSMRGDS